MQGIRTVELFGRTLGHCKRHTALSPASDFPDVYLPDLANYDVLVVTPLETTHARVRYLQLRPSILIIHHVSSDLILTRGLAMTIECVGLDSGGAGRLLGIGVNPARVITAIIT